jgi:hypothetical protein
MAIQYKIDADTHEGLDDSMRGLYVEKEINGETFYTLDVEGAEGEDDIAGLRKALKEERATRRKLEHQNKSLRQIRDEDGKPPLDDDDGDHSEEKTAELETIRKEYEKQLAEKDETITKLESSNVEKARAEKIAKAVATHGGDFEMIDPYIEKKLRENPDLDIDAEVAQLVKDKPSVFKPKFAEHTGMGGQPGMESAGRSSLMRSANLQRSTMSDRQKIDYQKEHGLDALMALPE